MKRVDIKELDDTAGVKRAFSVRVQTHGYFTFVVGAVSAATAWNLVQEAYSEWTMSNPELDLEPVSADQQVDIEWVKAIKKYRVLCRTPAGGGECTVHALSEAEAAEEAAAEYRRWEDANGLRSPDDAVLEVVKIEELPDHVS